MKRAATGSLQTVLIVENGSGDVFIVENKKSKSQVDKILRTTEERQKKAEIKIESPM